MKKLGHSEQAPRLLMSRENSRVLSLPGQAAFAVFGAHNRSRISLDPVIDDDYLDNVIRLTTMRTSRRKA